MPLFFCVCVSKNQWHVKYTCKECLGLYPAVGGGYDSTRTQSKTVKVLECSILSQKKKKKKADKT